jgi:hypothetical protein
MRRLSALLAVLVAASIAAACGEGALSSEEQPTGGQSGGRLSADKKASKSPMERARSAAQKASKLASDEGSPGTAASEMRVFSRPRTDADVLPVDLSYRLKPHGERACEWQLAHLGSCEGGAVADESRLLLTDLGVRKTSLYAWPTTNGWVCWAWAEGAGGCIADFTTKQPRVAFMGIDPDDEGTGYPGTLVGVAADDVASAEVQVRGVRSAATLESNGVFYELTDASCTMRAFELLIATSRDGSSGSKAIDWAHGATLDGEHAANVLPEGCAG